MHCPPCRLHLSPLPSLFTGMMICLFNFHSVEAIEYHNITIPLGVCPLFHLLSLPLCAALRSSLLASPQPVCPHAAVWAPGGLPLCQPGAQDHGQGAAQGGDRGQLGSDGSLMGEGAL